MSIARIIDENAHKQIFDSPISTLDGESITLGAFAGKVLLLVNVASKCGLTHQYEGLERLHQRYSSRGLAVLGFPCNQFGRQEPGNPAQIKSFCLRNYGVSFPILEKIEVNGDDSHPIYKVLIKLDDGSGKAGDVQWNFEKFLIAAGGRQISRFRPQVGPEAPELVAAIEAAIEAAPEAPIEAPPDA